MAALHSKARLTRRRICSWAMVTIAALLVVGLGQAKEESWQVVALQRAVFHHQSSRPEVCDAKDAQPQSYSLRLGEETAARGALLVAFACRKLDIGQSFVFVLSDQYGTVSDEFFPTPVVTSGEDVDIEETAIALQDREEVLNAEYEPDGRTMIAIETWPHSDEIRTRTQWGYYLGLFRLIRFEVDASADGQQDLKVLIENDIW